MFEGDVKFQTIRRKEVAAQFHFFSELTKDAELEERRDFYDCHALQIMEIGMLECVA